LALPTSGSAVSKKCLGYSHVGKFEIGRYVLGTDWRGDECQKVSSDMLSDQQLLC